MTLLIAQKLLTGYPSLTAAKWWKEGSINLGKCWYISLVGWKQKEKSRIYTQGLRLSSFKNKLACVTVAELALHSAGMEMHPDCL